MAKIIPQTNPAIRRWFPVLLSGLVASTLLVGCPQIEEDTQTGQEHKIGESVGPGQEGDTGTRQKFEPVIGKPGGQRVISSISLPKTFNVYLAAETSSTDVLGQMYLGLVTTDASNTEIVPSLAESWTISDDKMTYTFKLREGLKWSDGHLLTADDVVFTYNEVIDNKDIPNNYRDGLLLEDKFPKVEKVDDRTVRFTTHKPFAPFLRGLSDPIVPKHILGNTTKKDSTGKVPYNQMWGLNTNVSKIVCNGPWKLNEYVAGQRVVLAPNPNYYLKDKQGTQLPYLEKFVTMEVQDLSVEIIRFKAKETDSLSLRGEDYDTLAPEQQKANFKIHNLGPATGTLFVMFNMSTATGKDGKPVIDPKKSAWFKNVLFRQAMAHAINKKGMLDSIYKGRGESQVSHISQQNPFYKPDVKEYDYDLTKAAALLEEAGFKKTKGELMDAKGNRVEFNLVTNAGNTQRDAACSILRKDWSQLGIKVNYRPIQFNVMVQQIDQTLDWEAMMIGLTGSAIEPHFGINTWKLDGRMHMFNMGHPSDWKGKSGTTFEPWEQEMLDLYEKAATEFDFEKRKQLYWQSQDLAAANVPFLYTVNQLSMVAARNNIGNLYPSTHGGSALNQINWNTDYHFIKQ